jgi:hypothetical protein
MPFLESLLHDFKYALRLLRKSPVFTAAVILSLALGIGANTAIFSLIDAVMWRTLPVKDPESLVLLTHSRGTAFQGGFTYQQYRIMREQQGRGFTELAAWSSVRLNVSIDGSLEPTTDGQLVSGSYFSLLVVSPIAGRAIGPEDDVVPNGHPVAMITTATGSGALVSRHRSSAATLRCPARASRSSVSHRRSFRRAGRHIAQRVCPGHDAADRDAGLRKPAG